MKQNEEVTDSETNINEAGIPVTPKAGFGRIFESMYKGSMVGAGADVFALWPYVIAHMRGHPDHGALVELNPKLLTFVFGSEEEKVKKAIQYLCDPDPESRTKVEEGRRLVKLGQFLYRVVNGGAYMAIRKKEDERFSHAIRQAKYEAKKKNRVEPEQSIEDLSREQRRERILKKIEAETLAAEEVRKKFNPGYTPKPKSENGGLCAAQIISKAVREDPITKQDRATMRYSDGGSSE